MIIFTIPSQTILGNAFDKQSGEIISDEPTIEDDTIRRKIAREILAPFKPINKIFWVSIKADPAVLDIRYGETATLDFGMLDLENYEFDRRKLEFYLNSRVLRFEVVEYPDGKPENWFVSFDPSSVNLKAGEEKIFKTTVSISLRSPPSAKNSIQSGMMKLRMMDTWACGNMWFPPKEGTDWSDRRGKWFLIAFLGKWGNLSGTVFTNKRDVDVLVNIKPYNSVRFDAVPIKNIEPGKIASIPISLENLGNYNDTFNFRVADESNGVIISNPVSITLKPGEVKNTLLAVATPLNPIDTGTIHKVEIQAYSIDKPNTTIAKRTVLIQTQGIYISELSITLLVIIVLILLFIGVLYLQRRKNFFKKASKKTKKKRKKRKS